MDTDIKTLLLQILEQGHAHTQQEICAVLSQKGFEINQTKISRLLHKIGAVKIKDVGGHLVYHRAHEQNPPQKNMLISELVLEIEANQTLIVISTQPGSAAMIARLVDFNKNNLNILGTLSGDDTVFVAPRDINAIPKILPKLKTILSK